MNVGNVNDYTETYCVIALVMISTGHQLHTTCNRNPNKDLLDERKVFLPAQQHATHGANHKYSAKHTFLLATISSLHRHREIGHVEQTVLSDGLIREGLVWLDGVASALIQSFD